MEQYKKLQNILLEYLNEEDCTEEKYQNLFKIVYDQKINKDQNEFRLFLHLIDNISNYHYRTKNFLSKIERILLTFKKEFSVFLSNAEIFIIFKNNKRILFFLIENGIICIDQFFKDYIDDYQEENYPLYFKNKINTDEEIDKDFIINQKNGENEQIICQYIRDDNISDFITYVNQNDLFLDITINNSIFETNPYLMNKTPTLIEYSAFFGSVQIFTYLLKNNATITPSIWLYSIHGSSPEIINLLEEKKIQPEKNSFNECLIEAIKCHHNEIITYILENILQNDIDIDNINELIETNSIIYYNYSFFPIDFYNRKNFYYFCKYDYYPFIEKYLKNKEIDINFKLSDSIDDCSYIFTPLLISIQRNNFNIVELLLKQPKIDANFIVSCCDWSKREETLNALIFAIINESIELTNLLLKYGDIDMNKPLIIKEKKENGYIKIDEYYPLHEAIISNNIEIIKILLSNKKTDVNVKQKIFIYYGENNQKNSTKKVTALEKSIENSNIDIVKLLVNHPNIDINKYSTIINDCKNVKKTPLILAILNDDSEIVELLLNHPNIDVNIPLIKKETNFEKIEFPLLLAIQKKNEKIVRLLLSHPKIDVNQISTSTMNNNNNIIQRSPLTLAIKLSNPDIVSLLLSNKNIDVNIQIVNNIKEQKIKENPLCMATYLGLKEIVELLLINENIDVNAKYEIENKNGFFTLKNSLIIAVEKQNLEIEKLLLCHPDINVNVKLIDNNIIKSEIKQIPLLHLAISQKNFEIVKNILDNKNIDINIKSSIKKRELSFIDEIETPTLYHAVLNNNLEIIKLLLLNHNLDLNAKLIKTFFKSGSLFINETTPLKMVTSINNLPVFNCLFNYLRKNKQITDNLYNLMDITTDDKIKSIIYDEINKQS